MSTSPSVSCPGAAAVRDGAGCPATAAASSHLLRRPPDQNRGKSPHPASLGATDAFAEAEILQLYDPDRSRSRAPAGTNVDTWDAFARRLRRGWRPEGAPAATACGCHRPITSPTLAATDRRGCGALPTRWSGTPRAPDGEENARRGAALAFGRPLDLLPRFDRAAVVLCLDADPLGPGPDQIRNARAFAAQRQARAAGTQFGRL